MKQEEIDQMTFRDHQYMAKGYIRGLIHGMLVTVALIALGIDIYYLIKWVN